jgi:FixJ family two-component response regulator
MRKRPLVVIVDDDLSVRESLPNLVRDLGYAEKAFGSAEEFMASDAALSARCLILDIGLPGISGPELRRELMRRGYSIPTIFITGRAGNRNLPGLLEEGCIACLLKPFGDQELESALNAAFREKG